MKLAMIPDAACQLIRVILLTEIVITSHAFIGTSEHPGPKVVASKGAVWPQPYSFRTEHKFFSIEPTQFSFQATGLRCIIIDQATVRYLSIMKKEAAVRNFRGSQNDQENPLYLGGISALTVRLTKSCEKAPHLEMDETYSLTVNDTSCELTASTTWGILRGLETFVQLQYPVLDGKTLFINVTTVEDKPRFPHRGLLLDTSRHYLPLPYILMELDAMATVKMNVLHWHIVDDQSFPYQSRRFPELSNKGAYNNISAIYTSRDISRVTEYARRRGIRVIPEFDTPGHTRSWAEGQPGLITECYAFGQPTGEYSNVDPTKESNRQFIKELFAEVGSVFYDKFVHIGGDEVPDDCWSTNPGVLSYMRSRNLTGNYRALKSMYIKWLVTELEAQGKESIAWEEVFTERGAYPPSSVIIHIWLSDPAKVLRTVLAAGYRAIISQGWYLDHLDNLWQAMYRVEPTTPNLTPEERSRILGGEACMWGEMVDGTNLHSRVWPRAAAVAERLWSRQYVTDLTLAAKRLEELTCRLRRRGIPASPPNGPGYCQF